MAICPYCERTGPDVLEPCPTGDGYICIDDDDFHQWPDDPLLGREVGDRYVVLSVLGRGAMGRVYKARQKQVDRMVALKVFRPEMLLGGGAGRGTTESERERAEERFVREARVLGRFSHPNCVTLYDFGSGPKRDFLYMAMEFVAGLSLREAIKRGVKFEAILSIAIQTADALNEAHAHNVIHRDLKPDNVVLAHVAGDGDPTVKVLDFGIAKLARAGTESGSSEGVFGTPAYMSPEQCRGATAEVGPASDVYALGCICYEMICGRLPYETSDPEEMMRMHLEAPLPEVTPREGLRVPAELKQIVRRCMAKDADERWPDVGAFRQAVADVMRRHAEADETEELTISRIAAVHGGNEPDPAEADRQVEVPDNRVASDRRNPFVDQPLDAESAWGNDASGELEEEFEVADTVIDPEAAERWANMDTDPERTAPEQSAVEVGGAPGEDEVNRSAGESAGAVSVEGQRDPWEDAEQTAPLANASDSAEFEAETTLPGRGSKETLEWLNMLDRQVLWALLLLAVVTAGCVTTFVWIYLMMAGV